jgi:hypothetical protein
MTGFLSGGSKLFDPLVNPFISEQVSGYGLVSFSTTPSSSDPNALVFSSQFRWQFTPTPEPVASMLVAAGLAAVALRYKVKPKGSGP